MQRISKHISYEEATKSLTAIRLGIDNTPNAEQIRAMQIVASNIFEPVREWLKLPIKINSFFRSEKLNVKIGGSKTSDHCKGFAIDVDCVNNALIFDYIKNNLVFSQLIWEFGNNDQPDWVHFSFVPGNNKKQVLRASKSSAGKTIYTTI